MVGKPYVVAGRTYKPRPGHGYDREGWASWYGRAFHGRLTANGEIFDRQSIAAAHPTLPLPSYVRITNVANRRSIVVRVNDRGPYEAGRIIDLSERAAEALDMRRRGTARVRVQYLRRASTNGSDDAALLATLRTDGTLAQLGSSQPSVHVRALEREPATRTNHASGYVHLREEGARPASKPPLAYGAPVVQGSRGRHSADAGQDRQPAPAARPEFAGIY